jgi:hypothetical protein
MLVLLVAAAKILAVKAGTSVHLTRLPRQPTCLTRSACLVCARYQHSYFVEVYFLLTNMALAIYFSYISMVYSNSVKIFIENFAISPTRQIATERNARFHLLIFWKNVFISLV